MFVCERYFQPKLWKRKLLKKALIVESMLVGEDSLKVLEIFERENLSTEPQPAGAKPPHPACLVSLSKNPKYILRRKLSDIHRALKCILWDTRSQRIISVVMETTS